MSEHLARLFVDVSYTRTQSGNIGITRTVRRLLDELGYAGKEQGVACQAIAVHSRGFRNASLIATGTAGAAKPQRDSVTARLLRWTTSSRHVRAVASWVPLAWLFLVWRLYTRWSFNTLSRGEPPVQFRPGDVVFLPDAGWHYEGWRAAKLARRQGARVVLMVYDLIPLRQPRDCEPLVSRVFGHWLERSLQSADAIVCISRATEADLHQHARAVGLTLPPTRSFRLGADLSSPEQGSAVASAPIAGFLNADVPVFAAVGSFETRKNYAWLLQVFEGLWSAGHDLRLLIMGRPTSDGAALIDQLRQHPEHGRRLLTVLDGSDADLAMVYSRARALLLPSRGEGFGLPLVEARTRGCLVIASDLPAFRELVDSGVDLYPLDCAVSMAELVLQHAAVDRRGSIPAMPAFTWRHSAAQCLEVMAALLTHPQQPVVNMAAA